MATPRSNPSKEPIAVIGSGCRFPGSASSSSKLWELLSQPRDVLKEIPSTRFNPDGFYHPDGEYHGHSNVRHSYVLEEDHRVFDADFFYLSANEASAVDPQQRILMECVYEALEAAGQPLAKLRGSDTAVYVGLMCEEYSDLQARELNTMPTYFPTGTARSIVSNRISYFFDWHGPSMTIDTACSSSLVAIHQAVQVLRDGTSRVAVAGGTNLIMGPEPYIAESTFHMLSPQGRCHMWDAGADGYGRGDGVAAVLMKRLSDAIADGDNIEYIIRETGVNQDGRTKGITSPNPDAQVKLMRQTYENAGLDLSLASGRPQYFEAHGTGTLAGDPVEAEAIYRTFGCNESGDVDASRKLFVGSIKSVVGHTEGTAGVAGLIKVGMALKHARVPPNLLFRNLNPAIEQFYGPLEVPTKLLEWPAVANGEPRRASVNSFGFGGTNAHAIVESFDEAPTNSLDGSNNACLAPFVFSAQSKPSLKRYLSSTLEYLRENPALDLASVGYSLHTRRSAFQVRTAYTAHSIEELSNLIESSLDGFDKSPAIVRPSGSATIIGIFTGQGAQWATMGKALIEGSPFVQSRLHFLQQSLDSLPNEHRPKFSLREELQADESSSKLHTATISQPLCTAIQIILVDLLHAAGVEFSTVVGHSSGEIACAYAAGFLSARDAIVAAHYRGLFSKLARGPDDQEGAMMAVSTSLEDAEEICDMPQFEGRVCIAACNSPTSLTLSGDADAIEEVRVIFEDEGKFARKLRVDKAYHSHHMLRCADAYLSALKKANVRALAPTKGPQWLSSVRDGMLVNGNITSEELSGQYWCDNLTGRVTFASAISAAAESPELLPNLAIEVGPHAALKGPAQDTFKEAGKSLAMYTSCLVRNNDAWQTFSDALGELWKHGADEMLKLDQLEKTINDGKYHQPSFIQSLPTYQWDHDRIFWTESRRSKALRTRPEPGHPLLGTLSPDSTDSNWLWHNVLRLSQLPWLNGHQLQGQTVFPAAAYVALAVEAATIIGRPHPISLIELADFVIGKAITLEDDKGTLETMFSLHIDSTEENSNWKTITASFQAHSTTTDGQLLQNSSGKLKLVLSLDPSSQSQPLLPQLDAGWQDMVPTNENDFYSELSKVGYAYSGSFRALRNMKRKFGHGRGQIQTPSPSTLHPSETRLLIHPGVLDSAFQAIFLAYSWPGDGRLNSLHVPVSIERIRIDASLAKSNPSSSSSSSHLDFVSTLDTETSSRGIIGDVDIFSPSNNHGVVQVRGIRVIPFATATAANDTLMFFENVWGVAFPNGELAVRGKGAPEEEWTLGWVLERLSYFYLRRLVRQITPEQESRAAWHHQKLLAYARQMVKMVEEGKQPYGKREWNEDSEEMIKGMLEPYEGKIEVQLMRAVGENLAANVRGETMIIEHMMENAMLDKYYVESLGLRPYTGFLTETIAQITHVHPHLRVLEIGAGTGGATKSILQRIDGAFDQYTFTDISPGFFTTAKGVFSAYNDRMDFKVLDAEKDVIKQGYKEGSYDLIIASLVLHATRDLHATMANVRRLLRRGGYLVMLEVTSNATMRMSFTMGGLEGWWLGADSGRPWSPCVSAAQWHSILLDTGFTGIESATPDSDILPRPFGVLVSRATDVEFAQMIAPSDEPSPISTIASVVIITGSSLEAIKAAAIVRRLLQPHCSVIQTVEFLTDFEALDCSRRPTVLYLADWEQPFFQTMDPASFDAMKALFSSVESIVWATKGCRQDRPYANMSVGLGRAMMMELSNLKLQLVDFDIGAKMDAQHLTDELLRISILARLEDDNDDIKGTLWNLEPETFVDSAGLRWVSRVKPQVNFNDSYNAGQRKIVKEMNPARHVIKLDTSSGQFSAVPTVVDDRVGEDMVAVQVTCSSTVPLQTASSSKLYACLGFDAHTKRPLLALAEEVASRIVVPKELTRPISGPIDGLEDQLQEVLVDLLSELTCNALQTTATAILIEPEKTFFENVQRFAKERSLKIIGVTSLLDRAKDGLHLIHPYASPRAVKDLVADPVSWILDLSKGTGEKHDLGDLLQKTFPDASRYTSFSPIFGFQYGAEAILEVLARKLHCEPVIDTAEPASKTVQQWWADGARWGEVVDWSTTDTVPATVLSSDSTSFLHSDKTYILFGLAGSGGLGLSLAEYLIRKGAKYIILTSRRPNANKYLVKYYASRGVRLEFMANDITDSVALTTLVDHIRTEWPPIAGIANGAMVLHDTSLATMSYSEMTRVLGPKVDGSRYLEDVFRNTPLDFFVMFSSLSCVFGNSGQSNYAAANMFCITLAAQRRQRGLAASVVDIGAIMGTGYMAREVSEDVLNQLVGAGYRKMSEHDFHMAFLHAIFAGRIESGCSEEVISGLHIAAADENFRPAWANNARFGHVTRTGRQSANTTGSSTASRNASVRTYLADARGQSDIQAIVQGAILRKLQQSLQLSDEIATDHAAVLQQRTDKLGVDSLVAVEIRSYLLKELDVDLPVLKILGDVTIQDMVNYAVEKLPAALVPKLGQSGVANLPPDVAGPSKATTEINGDHIAQREDINETEPIPVIASEENDASTGSSVSSDDLVDSAASSINSGPSSNTVPDSNRLERASKPGYNPVKRDKSPESGVEKTAEMSCGQSRFWVMNHLVDDTTAFNVSALLKIYGRIDTTKLSKAVQELGNRHEALRTSFFESDKQPVQGILRRSPLRLQIVKPTLPVSDEFQKLHSHRFDLEKGDLLRITLLSTSGSEHHLVVSYHHINMDSTSLVVLVHELHQLYSGKTLPAPEFQYPDFSAYQMQQLRSGQLDEQLTFWRNEFSSLPPPLPVLNISSHAHKDRPAVNLYANTHVELVLPASLVAQVKGATRTLRCTPFHVYATAFQVLLARMADTQDVCIGMADANRVAPGSLGSLGNFLNLLPLRLSTNVKQSFASLVQETRQKVLAALSNCNVPFDVLLTELGVQRSPSHSPLFQAFIDYRRVSEAVRLGSARMEAKEYALSRVPYDVLLDVVDDPNGNVSVSMIVQAGIYSEEEADVLLRSYVTLLQGLTGDLKQEADRHALFSKQDVEHGLKHGRGPLVDLPKSIFLVQLDEIAREQPDEIALKDDSGVAITWAQVVSKSFALAAALELLAVPSRSRIGVLQQPTVDWLITMFGIWRAGHAYVPLETTQGKARLSDVVREAQLAALVVHNETLPTIAEIGWSKKEKVINMSHVKSTAKSSQKRYPASSLTDEAMVFYTSGSTGTPKGISIPHRVVLNSLLGFLEYWPMSRQVMLQQTPLSFDVSWWTALLGLATKGSVVVATQAARRDPQALTKLIVKEGVTITFAVPSESIAWLDSDNLDALRDSQWTYHMSGGEPYSIGLIQHLRALNKTDLRAINVYGPTEANIPTSYEVPYTSDPVDMPVPIGKPLPNYHVYVVDDQNRPLPAGIPGHLIYAGAGIAAGYVGDAQLSADKFPEDEFANAEFKQRGWHKAHRSGDYGYIRQSDGVVVLQGRIDGDTQIKLRGLRMDMRDIEANMILYSEGNISNTAVLVQKPNAEDTSTHYLAAYVVFTRKGQALLRKASEKAKFLAKVIREIPVPDYMRPAKVVPVDALPLNAHGKVDRRALRDQVVDSSRTKADERPSKAKTPGPPRVSGLDKMRDIWQQVLDANGKSHNLTAESEFFQVGGNSLLLIRVQKEVRRQCSVDIALTEYFQHSSLGAMAEMIGGVPEPSSIDTVPKHAADSIDWEQEIAMDPVIKTLRAPQLSGLPARDVTVVLTGSTGFLGRALLWQMVESPRVSRIHCVAVRKVDRLREFSSFRKITIHRGDLSEANLGMSSAEASAIFATADVVIHNGADTSFMKSYASVKGSNMFSTKELVRLALQNGHVRQFHYVSTAGIATQLGRDLYDESLASMPPSNGREGYVLSKWASEIYLENVSSASGMSVTIHRPTAITGDGAPQLDVMHNVLHFSEQLGAVPRMDSLEGAFQFVDVETVAKDMAKDVFAATKKRAKVHYLNHGGKPDEAVPIDDLHAHVSMSTGRAVEVMEDAEWISTAERQGLAAEVASYLRSINPTTLQGRKWLFPRVWNGARPVEALTD